MKFRTLLLLMLLTFPCLTVFLCGQEVQVTGIRIIESGVYSNPSAPDSQTLVLQPVNRPNLLPPKLLSQTDKIPARLGTLFGFGYVIEGTPVGQNVNLMLKVLYPSAVKDPKTGKTSSESTSYVSKPIGKPTHYGFSFEDPSELVTGVWTFEIHYKGKRQAQVKFTVEK